MAKITINESIELPEGVEATVENNTVSIKGKRGVVERSFPDTKIELKKEGNAILLSCAKATKREKARAFSYRAHIRNIFKGVVEGHSYQLKICSSHFPMNVAIKDKQIIVKNFLGEKVPRVVTMKDDVEVKIDGTIITVESASKELAGQTAADIEQLCRITNRDRRIFQDGIYITNKDGKNVS